MYRAFLNPVSELQQMIDFVDRAFAPRMGETNGVRTQHETLYNLPVDIWQKENTFFIRAAVPGIRAEDLDIQFQDNVLTISGETKHEQLEDKSVNVFRREYTYGKFVRSIRLPEFADAEKIEANFENGFVTITVPLAIQTPKSLKVPVKTVTSEQTPPMLTQEAAPHKKEEVKAK
jgi:HSP20 family protein